MMNKYIVLFLFSIVACTDLGVDIKSELSPSNFPLTEEQFIAASGSIYNEFALGYTDNYWQMSELSADAAVLTANGGNWYDGGRYKELHLHTWTKTSEVPRDTWKWLYRTINKCNSVYALFEQTSETNARNIAMSEIKVMRALCYYLLLDNYGDVPLIKTFGEDLKPRTNRKEVYDYIEQQVKEALPYLKENNDISTYGRPNRMTAFALLAKLYVNSEAFINTPMHQKAIDMCDSIIGYEAKGKTGLEKDYAKMFDYDNGPQIKEFIFAIPYDENNLKAFRPSRYWLSIYHPKAWGLKYTTSCCMRILPSYYDILAAEPNDLRAKVLLTEEQYTLNGAPMKLDATKVQLDGRYTGADKDEKVSYHIKFTKEIEFRNEANFDTGDDVVGRLVGYRTNKYRPSSSQLERYHSNDMPVFRYADILLMKAELILRSGGDPQKAIDLVNRVRLRAETPLLTNINLDILLDERARELNFECWRRNDLIRFGKFENKWLLKVDANPDKRLFAIPQSEREANPLLTQNKGY